MMASFGARLKAAREANGISLRQIAGATRISMTALEALERDDFSRLPGGIFSRAFIRAYALEVGIDPETTVNEFLSELGRYEREAATESARPEVTPEDQAFLERQKRATNIFRVGLFVVVALVIALVFWQGQRLLHEFSPSQPPAGKTADTRIPDQQPPPVATSPSGEQAVIPETGAISIEFRVTGDCFVQVSSDGLTIFSKTMRAGESQRVSAQRELDVQVDNAGAFQWTINGKAAKPLGRAGERKKAQITPANAAEFVQ